jgi:VanZ family protein
MKPTSAPAFPVWLPRFAALLWVLWLATLWWLSSRSAPVAKLPTFQFGDKVAHFGYFFVGGSLLVIALRDVIPNWKKRALCVIAASALVGAGDEFHQSFVPNRYGNDPWDWLADVLGGTAAALFVRPRPRAQSLA